MECSNMAKMDTKLSKFISLVLRHKPEEIGLALDANGWANVAELIKKANNHKFTFSLEDLQRVVAENDKKRFSFSEDGKKIRANQGHSIEVDLALEAAVPPAVLYHGTATRFLGLIMHEGLKPMQRHDVHMTESRDTAVATGRRHGSPIVLQIDAARMALDGIEFRRSDNGVWLTPHVDPMYITIGG